LSSAVVYFYILQKKFRIICCFDKIGRKLSD
jgi:hypothetical protein